MEHPSSTHRSHGHSDNSSALSNVNITNITSMSDERDHYDDQSQESARCEKSEQRRKIKLAMLMQQLEFLFYALVVLCYTLDGKNLIFILRTVSEVQFSQPKQIQPDRPLRFFALASFAICFCALTSHLSLLSASNYNPSGILVDFIGQFSWNHPIAIVAFLVGLDISSCLVQLLLVLISFTQSHSISISVDTSATRLYDPSVIISPDHDDIEANQSPRKTSEIDRPSDLRNLEETPNERDEGQRRSQSRINNEASDAASEGLFLFDLTISQVKSLLFSTDPPTPHNNTSTTSSSTATPTSTPRPSRAQDSSQLPIVPTANLDVTHGGSRQVTESRDIQSAEQSFVPANLPPRAVIIPMG